MMNCDTDFRHCTQCGSYAIKDLFDDVVPRRTSKCCYAPIANKRCKENHPPYVSRNQYPPAPPVPPATPAEKRKATKGRKAVAAVSKARGTGSHANCSHESSSAARRKCRAERAAS